MNTTYNEDAERILHRVLTRACADGWDTTRGGYMGFPIAPGPQLGESHLKDYCLRWMEPVNPPLPGESGWRPRVVFEDNTVTRVISQMLVNCQGRPETVRGLSVIVAGFACRIPADIVMACPSAAVFWDWSEKHRIRTKSNRPISTLVPHSFGDDLFKPKTTPKASPFSRSVADYTAILMDEKTKALMEERRLLLSQDIELRYIRPSLDEAERLIQDSLRVVFSEYDGDAYLRTYMQHPHTITPGQLIAYCKQVYHSSELYNLGTRWRPCGLTANRRKEIRGGISLYDPRTLCIDGSAGLCKGLSPVLAGLRIRLDPKILRKTNTFYEYFSQLGLPWISEYCDNIQPIVHSDWEPDCDWRSPADLADYDSVRFAHEEQVMSLTIAYLRSEYSRSLGQYQGGDALATVRWSQEDFVNNLMQWWPEAEIQDSGYFRYVPTGLDKGGIRWFEPGEYFSAQGRSTWQGAFMPMIASLICGIPAEIASLLKASDLFWSTVFKECGGKSVVQYHRDRLRQLRDRQFGHSWHQQRGYSKQGNRSYSNTYWNRGSRHNQLNENDSGRVNISTQSVSYETVFKAISTGARYGVTRTPYASIQEISSYICEIGKILVGSQSVPWSLTGTDMWLTINFDFKPVIETQINDNKFMIQSVSTDSGYHELAAAIACRLEPTSVPETCPVLTDYIVRACFPSNKFDLKRIASYFARDQIDKVRPLDIIAPRGEKKYSY